MRTAQTIAQKNAEKSTGEKPKQWKRNQSPAQLANLVTPWTKETKPKSPGRPRDRAAELSRKVIENNEEAIYKGWRRRQWLVTLTPSACYLTAATESSSKESSTPGMRMAAR
jgi:hypothetical protein